MEFFTIVTKYDIFVGDIILFDTNETKYYCISIENQTPQVLDESQFNDFKNILFTIYNYKIIKDGVNDDD